MIEVFYNGNEPVIINNIEFNKTKIAKITEEQLNELNKISFFKDRINKNFKVVNRNIKKEEKQEDKAEEVEEVDLDKLTFKELKEVADNLELEYQNNIKKKDLKNLIKNATTETNNS